MALKRALQPLDHTLGLADDQLQRLRSHSVTTVEELVGTIDADDSAVAGVLDISVPAVHDLREHALARLSPERRAELAKPPERRGLGAVHPDELERPG